MSKVLSVIVAAYNVEKYLENTLSSCVLESRQLQEDYEVIVVNDGSTDETSAIARSYMQRYPDVFRVIDKINGGYGSVINEGIKAAKGKYFKLLDGDDWYDTKALEEMVQCLKQCEDDMVLTSYSTRYEVTGRREIVQYDQIKEFEEVIVQDLPTAELQKLIKGIQMHGICYKTEILRKISMPITEHCFYTDNEYVIYGMAYIKTVIYYPIDLYQYRIGREGQSVSIAGIARHIGDLEHVINDIDIFYTLMQREINCELVNYKIALIYRAYITYLLLLPSSKIRLQKIETFDNGVKEKYPDRYQWMENRKVRILRITKYKAYWLCHLYCIWEKSRSEK